jgi:hypothetical protein
VKKKKKFWVMSLDSHVQISAGDPHGTGKRHVIWFLHPAETHGKLDQTLLPRHLSEDSW